MDVEAEKFVDDALADSSQPVVVFALEWCEFCWSVRKFFQQVDVAYRAIDLDSVAFQEGERGRRIRAVLSERTQMKTIPQIFIGGKFFGGCTDVFDSWKDGQLQVQLTASNIAYDAASAAEPYSFLPAWLHPR